MTFALSFLSFFAFITGAPERMETPFLHTPVAAPDLHRVSLSNTPVRMPGHAPRQQADGRKWTYQKTADREGGPVYKASLLSSNTLQFEYPYTGGSTATLTLRQARGSTHVYIEVVNGQFNRSFQGGSARIRFDGKPPRTFALSAAANGRANIVFFDSERALIAQIKAAREMLVQVDFQGQGIRQVSFRTAGLQWNH